MMITMVRGQYKNLQGTLYFDPADLTIDVEAIRAS